LSGLVLRDVSLRDGLQDEEPISTDEKVVLFEALVAAGVLPPERPVVYDLADGPQALAALESRVTVGKLALRP